MDVMTPRLGRRAHPKGALKNCKKCNRRHRTGEVCRLFLRERETKAGDTVRRWAA